MARSAAVVLACAFAGCVPSQTSLNASVHREIARRAQLAPGDVAALLGKPLDADAAARVALANSPRVRAALDDIGVASADLAVTPGPVDADVFLRFGDNAHDLEIDVVQDLMGLVAAPRQRAAGRAGVAAATAKATAMALQLVARVEIAFHEVLAAQQEVELRRTAFDAADAAATLRERMHAAGNTTTLALARDRDAREQARIDLARAESAVEIARERLNALLGLSGEQTKWTAAGRLPAAPADAPKLDDLEGAAVAASLDIAAAEASVAAASNRAAEASLRAVLPRVGVGVSVEDRETLEVGPALRVGVPLFDWGTRERTRARAERSRSEHELVAVAVELRARARAARIAALSAHQEARHIADIVLPLRQQVLDETLKHYNAMDADPFALIVARRDLVEGSHQYLDALRRYANAMTVVAALRRGADVEADGR